MALSLFSFSAGDTAYIAKMNANNILIETAFNGLTNATDIATATGTVGTTLNDIWDRSGLVGASSMRVTCATSQTLSVTSGSWWNITTVKRGVSLSNASLNFGAKTSGIYQIIADGAGGLSVSVTSAAVAGSALAIYQIQYNAPNFGSAERLVPILFHGDDYARMLSSPVFGSFTRVADRLSSMEGGDGAIVSVGGGSGAATGTGGVAGLYAQLAITSAVWTYAAGHLRNNNLIVSTAASTLPLEASATHFVEVAISNGSVSYTLAGWTSGDAIALRKISTCSGALSGSQDVRTWAIAGIGGSGGGGAGTPGLANSGTTDGLWQLYRGTGATSSPVSDAVFAVDRGSQNTASIRWNETSDKWEFSENGTTFTAFLGMGNLDLGGGAVPRLNILASAPAVLEGQGLSTSATAALISLSAYTSTTTTIALIRGTAFDSALSALGTSTEPFPGVAFYQNSGTIPPGAAAKIVANWQSGRPEMPQFLMVPVASQTIQYVLWSASTASLKVSTYLVGYVDLIQGVGTTLMSATRAGLTGPISTVSHVFSMANFSGVGNRLQVFYLEISSTLPAGSTYDLEFYGSDGGVASQLQFQALAIDASAAYITRLPWVYRDLASTSEVYLRISHQAASAGTFSVKWVAERFA